MPYPNKILWDITDFLTLKNALMENLIKTYLMKDTTTNYIKIGKSKDVIYREKTLQAEKPTIEGMFYIEKDIEKLLHGLFDEKRIRGEWFNLNHEDIDFLNRIIRQKGLIKKEFSLNSITKAEKRTTKPQIIERKEDIILSYMTALSFTESLLIAKMCNMIEQEDKEFKDYRIYIKDLLSQVGKNNVGGTTYAQIYEAAEKLRSREIQIRFKDEKARSTIIDTTIATSTEKLENEEDRKGEESYISLTFHPKLKPYLLQLKQDFTRIDLDIYQKIHASHAIRLYHIFSSYFGRGQKRVFLEVQELKEMLGIAEKYSNFTMFKKYVLEDSQKRLNQDTDLNFTYQIRKRGKTVLGIDFYIIQNKKNISPTAKEQYIKIEKVVPQTVSSNDENDEALFHKLCPIVNGQWKVSIKMLSELIKNYSEQDIMVAYNLTEKALKKGNIENIAGYFIKAIKEKFVDVQAEQKKKEAEIKVKIKKEQAETNKKEAEIKEKSKANFEKLYKIALKLVSEDKIFLQQVIENLGMYRQYYNIKKSVFENLENSKGLTAVFVGKVQELQPQAFK